jgi:putative restriction endonuclease
MVGPLDDREPTLIDDPLERQYATREVKVRLHQRRFRWLVIPAYRKQCAICRLKEVRLLDAAHIVADVDPIGTPDVANGLSLCSIHHRAFDQDLLGVSPDYKVHLAQRLLEDEDGPMLDVLKRFQGEGIQLPRRTAWQPDRERLALRFERFNAAA